MINITYDTEKYKKIRQSGINLHSKIIECLDSSEMKIVMRALGVLKKNTIVVDSEQDLDRCFDFAINDYRNRKGENLIQIYVKKNISISKDEKEIIAALLASKSSLYKVVDVNTVSNILTLNNLLDSSEDIQIVDVNLSSASSALIGFIMYSRIVKFSNFNITSGAPLLFESEHEQILLKKYKQKMKKIVVGDEQTKFAAAFFHLYQKYGFKQMEYA